MIRGEKSSLRALRQEDAGDYYRWINDPETNVFRGLYHPTSLEQVQKWIEDQSNPTPDHLTLALQMDKEEDAPAIGIIGLRGICSRSRRAELWIYIGDKTQWRNGYGSDAIKTLCRYAFDEMNLHRIWMECDPESVSAVKCYKFVGFKEEGRLRQAYYRRGAFRDTCIMGLLRTDNET